MMDKNIKNTNEKLRFFRNVDTGKTEPRYKHQKDDTGMKIAVEYRVKVYDKMYFTEDQIKNWNFKGDIFPIGNNRNFTIIHNYILHVWSYYLGKDATFAYIMLRSYDFHEREITTTSKQTIAKLLGIKAQTLTEYMNILEKYDFGYMFQTERENDGMQVGSVFVVRSTVPILPPDLYEGLPAELKKEADRIVKSMKKNTVIETCDGEDNDARDEAVTIKGNEKSEVVEAPAPNKVKSFDEALNSVISQLRGLYSDVQYNTWFKNYVSSAWMDKGSIFIPVPNEFTKDVYEQRYTNQLKELFKLYMDFTDIKAVVELN